MSTPPPVPAPGPTKALILAAGRGERMRPLTDHTPKPLLAVRGRPMIEWHLEALSKAGVREVVINTAWLEEQFPAVLGEGERWGLRIRYSHEGRRYGQALETAGGLATALPLLQAQEEEPIWLVAGDIVVPDFDYAQQAAGVRMKPRDRAHLWLVPNPAFHPQGDFSCTEGRLRPPADGPTWTYSSLALVRPSLVAGLQSGIPAALGPLLLAAAADDRAGASRWDGTWHNVGTPEQLRELQAPVSAALR